MALARRGNGDLLAWTTGSRAERLDGLDDLKGLVISDLAEDDVLAIEPAGDDGGDEELRAVGVWAGVLYDCVSVLYSLLTSRSLLVVTYSHAQKTWAGVLELEVLVLELLAID